MEYAAPSLTRSPSRRSIVVPLVALVLGAGIATGTYALIDNGSTTTASKVIVVERTGPHAATIPGKNESATAAAIGGTVPQTASHPNEAATAASISGQSGIVPRGSKASATGIPSPSAASAEFRAQQLREDPHGTASQLHNP
jgi:hypothetical protein